LFALDTPIAYSATANPNAARFDSTYEAESAVPTFDFETLLGRSTGARAWSEEVRAEYLRLPADPRYRDLALSLTSRLKPEFSEDPFAQAWVIKQYLDENGIYSLKNAHAAEVDPAASFLFGDLTGYCVHFAFSAVYLYRSLGIPARVGVGYSVPASNRGGGSSLLIQAIHGHAWPEIYFRDIGWVIVDPAPQQTLVDMSTDPQDNLQQMLGDMLRDDASFDEYRRLRSEEGFDWLGMSKRLLNWLGLGVGLAIIAGYVAKFCRRIAPRFAAPAARHRASYRAAADRLADLNIRRRFGESRESFAQRCAALSPQFSHLTQLHLEASFGSASSVSAQEFTQLDQRIQQELRGNVSPWRRLFGALHPFNWLAVR
jgi:transglutaminase-like putative cysteine protease